MYAILETGGKQYKVKEGDILEVEHIDQKNIADENQVNFAEVLLIHDKELHLGQPYVPDAMIQARILEAFKAPKIIVFKKKAKKGYKRTRGHRQMLHRIKIEKIEIRKAAKSGKDQAVPAEKKAGAVTGKQTKKTPATRKKAAAATTRKKTTSAKSQPKKTPKKEKEKK